jgi:hypothetical protein
VRRLLDDPVVPRKVIERRDAAASVAVAMAWMVAWITSVHVVFSLAGVIALVATVGVLVGALWAGAAHGTPSRRVVLLAAPVALVGLAISPPLIDVELTGGSLVPGVVVGGAALLGVGSMLLSTRVSPRSVAVATLAVSAVAFAMIIRGGRPVIDVWVILQDSARGLLAGRNPYVMHFPEVPPGQTDWCFNYWPGTFLGTAPAQWLLGDVRWANAVYLLSAPALLAWHIGGRTSWRDRPLLALGMLAGLVPGSLLVVQQSWNEPALLAGLVCGAVLMQRGYPNWAVLPLGLALATKQHLVVLLPLLLFWPRFGWRRLLATGGVAAAVSLPWMLADWGRFRLCTIDFFIDRPDPPTSLSVWQLVPEPVRLPLLAVGLLASIFLVLTRCPRTPGGFLMAAGTVLAVFSVLNKQAFVNQWWLVAALVLAGFALHRARSDDEPAQDLRPYDELAIPERAISDWGRT